MKFEKTKQKPQTNKQHLAEARTGGGFFCLTVTGYVPSPGGSRGSGDLKQIAVLHPQERAGSNDERMLALSSLPWAIQSLSPCNGATYSGPLT